MGFLGGSIAGLFLVGIFIKKVTSKEDWIGFLISIFMAFYIGNPMGIMEILSGYLKSKIFGFLISLVIIGSYIVPSWLMSEIKMRIKKDIEIRGN